MNNLLDKTYGKDAVIQDVQIDLYSELSNIWDGTIRGFGSVQTNPVNSGQETAQAYETSRVAIPEWYNAEKKDYESVYYNDDYSCTFCFIPSDKSTTEDEYMFKNEVRVVFSSDLDKVYPGNTQRLDERQVEDAVRILRKISYNRYVITGTQSRIENIFREFSTKGIKFNNMVKKHVFSVIIDLNYNLTTKCN